jgi:dienelactone hydrolase
MKTDLNLALTDRKVDSSLFYYRRIIFLTILVVISGLLCSNAQPPVKFSFTPLEERGDLSALMVEGIDRFLTKENDKVIQAGKEMWHLDFSSASAFDKSVSGKRELLARRTGVADPRVPVMMEVLNDKNLNQFLIETGRATIRAVRWSVLEGVNAGGILIQPKSPVKAGVIMIPDADVLPEVLAGISGEGGYGYGAALRLADAGCEVLIPVLVDRNDTFSGSRIAGRFTNLPHREWIYRQGFEVGRHVIGYELQKIFAAIDWMESGHRDAGRDVKIGIAGHGEGGLLALYASAMDTRISSAFVSGYFNNRNELWTEPIYRNIWGLLKYFGDAELAVMNWPRPLVIEYAKAPEIAGPPAASQGRSSGAAPGKIVMPSFSSVSEEVKRAENMLPQGGSNLKFIFGAGGAALDPFSAEAMNLFADGLDVKLSAEKIILPAPGNKSWINPVKRQERTVKCMEQHVQNVLLLCERTRNKNFWDLLEGDVASQKPVKDNFRTQFHNVIGKLPVPAMPANPRARLLQDNEKLASYEVMLDVWPDVFAWGILIIPKDIKPGEKRPAVICQHGLEGLPSDVVNTDPESPEFPYYQGFATRLAERGYVTFSPHNPYRGADKFRVLQRKANPVELSLFSVMTGQNQRIVEWLGQQSFIDPARIGYYGLSYGGKAAMRLPALIEGFALSVCAGDFNEWVRKNSSVIDRYSYMYAGEYEMPEWDLGHTFNYAEMAALIAPRPFMVERGHFDGVGVDEWVSYEYAKVRRHFDLINFPGNTCIEYFNGGHMVKGEGSFEFLDKFLFKK